MSYPPPAGGPPPSFKTNVHRAKTKRWVEAKSYSYDGDDWGDADDYDEYGGYGEPVAPAPQKPTGLRQRGQSATQPVQAQAESHREFSDQERYGYGNMGGSPLPQKHYGTRSTTNPQPQVTTNLARSSSFDRGDDRRTFSEANLQQIPPSAFHGSQQLLPKETTHDSSYHKGSTFSPQEQNPPDISQQGPTFYQQESPQVFRPSRMMAQSHQPQSPVQYHSDRQASEQDESEPQSPRSQSYISSDRQFQDPQKPRSPIGARGASTPDQSHLSSLLDSTQSMTSSNSSLEFQNRRDFSPSAIPPPLHPRGSPSPRRSSDSYASSRFPPRKSSLSQGTPSTAPVTEARSLSPSAASGNDNTDRKNRVGGDDSSKPLPFVRPADIYKRMHEEKERARRLQEPSNSGLDLPTDTATENGNYVTSDSDKPLLSTISQDLAVTQGDSNASGNETRLNQGLKIGLEPVEERNSQCGIEKYSGADPKSTVHDETTSLAGAQDVSRPVLPDVTRMSGFGDLFNSSTSSAEGRSRSPSQASLSSSTQVTPQASSRDAIANPLQHRPSVGFRSIVHQAFDRTEDQIPATPSSIADSTIDRSTSGGTSVISPIISRGPSIATGTHGVEGRERRPVTPPTHTASVVGANISPLSSRSLGTPKQIIRKPSPAHSPVSGLEGPIPPSFIPGHRRETSTPSPNNSPARTPALEASTQFRQPQKAELAFVTPTEPAFPSGSDYRSPDSAPRRDTTFNAGESSLSGEVSRHSAGGSPSPRSQLIPPALSAPSENSHKPKGDGALLPSTLPDEPARSRADSPSKNRVRDLAEKFESGNHGPRGSDLSQSQPAGLHSTYEQRNENLSQARPPVDRLESFRPRLPGGWESFASNIPTKVQAEVGNDEINLQEHAIARSSRDDSDGIPSAPVTAPFAPTESENDAFGPPDDSQMSTKIASASQNPFAAVAAAGSALAGALVAAAGLENHDSDPHMLDGESSSNESEKTEENDLREKSVDTKRNRNVSTNTVMHPEALPRPATLDVEDEAPSEVSTPPLTELHQSIEDVEQTLGYLAPTAFPKKLEPGDLMFGESAAGSRNQVMLPPLSTDTKGHQYESDRLRREIVKNLGSQGVSEPTTAESNSPGQDDLRLSGDLDIRARGHDSMVIPIEYDSYWNGSNSGGEMSRTSSNALRSEDVVSRASNLQVSPTKPLLLVRTQQTANIDANAESEASSNRPNMHSHQFSWEKDSGEVRLPVLQSSESQPKDTPKDSLHERNLEHSQGPTEFPTHLNSPGSNLQKYDSNAGGLHLVGENPIQAAQLHSPEASQTLLPTQDELNLLSRYRGNNSDPVTEEFDEKETLPSYRGSIETSKQTPAYTEVHQPKVAGDRNYTAEAGLATTNELETSQDERYAGVPQQGIVASTAQTETERLPLPPPPPSAQPKIRPFREILALKTPEERTRAYNETRGQFANLDIGLAHWLTVMLNEFPEHADLLSGPQMPLVGRTNQNSTPSPLRAKISGLRAAGAQPTPQPYYQQYLGASQQTSTTVAPGGQNITGSNSSQSFSPGGTSNKLSSQHVQAKGKDLLHSAGVFGGKANTAAKGFFSKGRNRLRGSGIVDKVDK